MHKTWTSYLFGWLLIAVLGAGLLWPLLTSVGGAFHYEKPVLQDGKAVRLADGRPKTETRFSADFLVAAFQSPVIVESIGNSLLMAVLTLCLSTLIAVPLALLGARYRFPGKSALTSLVLVPMILPPFVGAVGMRYLFARYGGAVNLLLGTEGLDWFGLGRFWMVVVLQALHLYPILYLNATASLANVDPSMEEAAANLGAGPWRRFFRVTMPLMLPGYFAGASIVFIWAFTELGTPLILNFPRVMAVQVFEGLGELSSNPAPFALVVIMLSISMLLYYATKLAIGRGGYGMMARATAAATQRRMRPWAAPLATLAFLVVFALAVIPHVGVILVSLTPPGYALPTPPTGEHFIEFLHSRWTLAAVRNSMLFSSLATGLDLVLGVAIAYLLVRRRFFGRGLLDMLAMMPLAVPGLVLAFGYYALGSRMAKGSDALGWMDPAVNPTFLLVIAYGVRRLPYMVRSAVAGFQQTSETFSEAAANLGAGPLRTLRKVTVPLISANLIAGALLAFSFAMLEVSDSLVLAQKEAFYPITKAIYSLFGVLGTGANTAAAMGVWAMVLLALTIVAASLLMGKRLGAIFRA
jgi:iron(III) transport system permease protein